MAPQSYRETVRPKPPVAVALRGRSMASRPDATAIDGVSRR